MPAGSATMWLIPALHGHRIGMGPVRCFRMRLTTRGGFDSMRGLTMVLLAVILIGVAACGPGNGLNLAPVSGKVTYKGQPVKNGTVMFEPDESKGNSGPQAIGTIKSDGTYILSSQDPGDGAVVWMHRVGVLGIESEPVSAQALPSPEKDPMKYLLAKTEADLKAASRNLRKGGEKTITGLDGKTYRVTLPEKIGSTKTSGLTAEVSRGSNSINIDIAEDGSAKTSK